MRHSLLLPSLLLLSTCAFAQTVVPFKYATTEASTWTAWPFGIGTPAHFQYLYDSTLVAKPVVAISQIAFRGEGGQSAAAKKNVDLEIFLSTTKTDPWSASATFASNHGSNKTTAFKRKKVNLPAQPATTPNGFVTIFKLDKKFVYIRSAGNLMIDYVVHGQPGGLYRHDTSFKGLAVNTAVGTGCGGAKLTVGNVLKLYATSTIDYYLSGAPGSGIAVHLLGSAALARPVTLPLGGCKLYQNFFVVFALPTSSSGAALVKYRLPTNARDMMVYGQFVAFDSKLTKLAATRSLKTKIGGLDPHTRIFTTTSATALTGRVQLGVGIVTQLK